MGIELQKLVKKVEHMDISLIAGSGGLNNIVSWVHMVETIEASDFLEGGEIAFCTGLGLANNSLVQLVEYMYHKKVAGIMVNIGPFIEEIPSEVISFCDEHNFPLFVIPWRIHLAEVMRVFTFAITKEDQRFLETASAFKNGISFPKQEELYIVPLSQRGFHVNWSYSICVINLQTNYHPSTERIEKIVQGMNAYASHNYSNYAIFSKDQEILLIVSNCTDSLVVEFVTDMLSFAKKLLLSEESLLIGCGKNTKSIRCLYKSYNQAKAILRLHQEGHLEASMIFYSDMGIYKLLMAIEDNEIKQEYYERTVARIIEYDLDHGTDLVPVLKSYLRHNGSIKEAADELFVHRNTINYKLNKIEELINADLSALDIRLQIQVGFMLADMM